MKIINKMFLLTVLVLLVGVSAVSATDSVDNSTVDVADSVDDITVSDAVSVVEENTVEDNYESTLEVSNSNSSIVNVDNSTFGNYFSSNGTINVASGSTLNFTGDVSRTNTSYIIDVPVTIAGNGYTLNLNTSSLNFVDGSNYSNISDLNIVNTQIFINQTSHVTFDNITFNVTAKGLGSGVGSFAIREGSGYITVQNSKFNVTNNGGFSLITLTLAENCTINNNTIIAKGTVGNIIYMNYYGGNSSRANGVTCNKNNTISNNTITGPDSALAICYAVVVSGNSNKVINNTINYPGYAITTSWTGNITIDNETDPGDEHNLTNYYNQFINNTVLGNGRVTHSYNTYSSGNNFTGSVIIYTNDTFINNNVNGNLTIRGSNINITNNTLTNVTDYNSTNTNNTITNNTLTNLTIKGTNNTISYNTGDTLTLEETSEENSGDHNNFTTINDLSGANVVTTSDSSSPSSSKTLSTDEGSVVYITEDNFSTYFSEYSSGGYIIYNTGVCLTNGTTYYLDLNLENTTIRFFANYYYANDIKLLGVEGRVYKNVTFLLRALNMTFANFTMEDCQVAVQSWSGYGTYIIENLTMTGYVHDMEIGLNASAIALGYNVRSSADNRQLIFRNCYINYTADAYQIDWETTTVPYNIIMYVNTYLQTEISNNTIIITQSNETDRTSAPTLYGVYYQSGDQGYNNTFKNNTLILNGENYMYGLVLGNSVSGVNITGNNITVTSINYTCGIQLKTNDKNILISDNIINCTSGLEDNEDGNQYVVYDIYVENQYYMGGDYSYLGNDYNNTISNNTIVGTGNQVYGIEGYGYDNSTITGNTILVSGVEPQGIGIIGANLNITGNTIIANGTNSGEGRTVDYVPAITAGIQIVHATESNTNISNNNITVTTGRGVLVDGDYVNIDDNNIIVSNYDYSVELKSGSNNNVTNNYLKTSIQVGDGSVYESTEGNLIENNLPNGIETFISIDAISDVKVGDTINITGIITNTDGLAFTDSQLRITINGQETTVDVAENGSYTTEYNITTVGQNNITVEFIADDTFSYSTNSTTFEVPKIETNIELTNITVSPNTEYTITGTLINQASKQLENQTITIRVNNEIIPVNLEADGTFTTTTLTASSKPGNYDITVTYDGDDEYEATTTTATLTVTKYNTIITTTSITGEYNNTITLTATVTDTELNNITGGNVVFKLNGKTLVDEEGKAITAEVINGVAQLEYTITNNIGNYTINATYTGSEDYSNNKTENEAQLEVIYSTADITIVQLPSTIKSGDTIILTVSITDDERIVNDGIVIFKLNGVTIKNTDGGNLNATVINGIASVEYTIPTNYSAKDYTLTAIYLNKYYNRAETNETLTIIKSAMTTTINPLYITQGENTTLSLTVYDQNNNIVDRSLKINIKANGKTIVSTTAENGVVNIDLPTDTFKNNYYNITVILGENSVYNGLTLNTILIVNKDDNATKIE